MSDTNADRDAPKTGAAVNPSGREMREFERVQIQTEKPAFLLDEGYTVLADCDISRGGVSFLTDHKFDQGRRLNLNMKNTLGIDIEVMHCEMVMLEGVFLEAKYKVGCRFVEGPIDADVFSMVVQSLKE